MEYTVIPAMQGDVRLVISEESLENWKYVSCKAYQELKWVNDHFIEGALLGIDPDCEDMWLVEDPSVDLRQLDDEKVAQLVQSQVAKPIDEMWAIYKTDAYLVVLSPLVCVFRVIDMDTLFEYFSNGCEDEEE